MALITTIFNIQIITLLLFIIGVIIFLELYHNDTFDEFLNDIELQNPLEINDAHNKSDIHIV